MKFSGSPETELRLYYNHNIQSNGKNVSGSFIVMAILRNPPVTYFRAAYSRENFIQQTFTKPSLFGLRTA